MGSQPLCQVAPAGSVESRVSQPVMQSAEESSLSPRDPHASSWARWLSPVVREGGWSTWLLAVWKGIFRKDLTDILTSKLRLEGWKGKSWGCLGESQLGRENPCWKLLKEDVKPCTLEARQGSQCGLSQGRQGIGWWCQRPSHQGSSKNWKTVALSDWDREMVKDREVWHAAVHGIAKSRTQLRD